jgi:mycofactocin precursor
MTLLCEHELHRAVRTRIVLAEVAMPEYGSNGHADTDNTGRMEIAAARSAEEAPLVEESLIEEVSIDGMCGVY